MRAVFLSLIFLAGVFFEAQAQAQKAVLIEDAQTAGLAIEDGAKQVGRKIEKTYESNSGSSRTRRKIFDSDEISNYSSTYAMREDRRVGIGAEVDGKLGLLGVTAELNFALDDSAAIGFGGGPQFNSFDIGWKHVFGGKMIAPYVGVAYSRWYNNNGGGPMGSTTPAYLADKFLNSTQLQSGQFALNLLVPSAGLQFNMLSGEYAGTSIYVEAMALLSLQNFKNELNGCFGVAYYF